ncbi:hypothetical protein RJ639_019207 [Escallonia herrerae]|uniref:RABX5 catalytic core helical domain-containing protein n=1 Tax=Escallonia herrerae TaxID=1293975 RepID=A0AA88V8K8_9ASTE|nr:hypothetical protein RJ639_019207 [Escallonia herrerae]
MENADVLGSSTAPQTWHDFLERMRQPSATDFVKAIKSFIVSFLNNTPDPERDSAAVQVFLSNMEAAFRAHSLWAGCSEEELDSAGESSFLRHEEKFVNINCRFIDILKVLERGQGRKNIEAKSDDDDEARYVTRPQRNGAGRWSRSHEQSKNTSGKLRNFMGLKTPPQFEEVYHYVLVLFLGGLCCLYHLSKVLELIETRGADIYAKFKKCCLVVDGVQWWGGSGGSSVGDDSGLEKYVMTKLSTRVFASLPDDVKVDDQLHEKMALLQQFVRPENLDIPVSYQNETSWLPRAIYMQTLVGLGDFKLYKITD